MSTLMAAYRVWGWVKLVGAMISGAAIVGMMLFIVWDVVSRNVLGQSIAGGFEIVQNYFLPLSVFPAVGYVYGSGVLPRMDLVAFRLPVVVQNALIYALLVLEVLLFAVVVWFTWDYAMSGMGRGEAFPAAGSLFTVWPLFFMVPLAVVMIIVETIFVLFLNLFGREVALSVTAGQVTEATSA